MLVFFTAVYSLFKENWRSWSSSEVLFRCAQIPKLHISCLCCLCNGGLMSWQGSQGFSWLAQNSMLNCSIVLVGAGIIWSIKTPHFCKRKPLRCHCLMSDVKCERALTELSRGLEGYCSAQLTRKFFFLVIFTPTAPHVNRSSSMHVWNFTFH